MAPDADAGKSSGHRSDPFAPLTSQLLPVGDGHEIYVETVGRTDGIPAPAAAASPTTAGCSIRNDSTRCCSISVAPDEAAPKAGAKPTRCRI